MLVKSRQSSILGPAGAKVRRGRESLKGIDECVSSAKGVGSAMMQVLGGLNVWRRLRGWLWNVLVAAGHHKHTSGTRNMDAHAQPPIVKLPRILQRGPENRDFGVGRNN
ncbi:hypothetical protein ACA910_018900 [Epithemia clementina (nom. ined.)]